MSLGIEKELDNLGRIVLPVKFRNQLGLKSEDKVLISLHNDTIFITPTQRYCALCGKHVTGKHDLRLCNACIQAVKKLT
ncbi:MAG: AbrB/MazE/SpoVT family DNA-binding domain-containing protein [Clostridia bacterium]|nr:AbrB/MazE/SpoVT family DNA-binding domain-containing protein [Clostridia bacterium]